MMSDDYAELIKNEHGGHVDLIYGVSYGGIVAQHFAADHYDLCDYLVIGAAAHKVEETEVMVDYRYAKVLNQGKPRQALASMAEPLYSNKFTRAMMSLMLPLGVDAAAVLALSVAYLLVLWSCTLPGVFMLLLREPNARDSTGQ